MTVSNSLKQDDGTWGVELTAPGAAMVVPRRRVATTVVAFMFATWCLVAGCNGDCRTECDGKFEAVDDCEREQGVDLQQGQETGDYMLCATASPECG